VETDKILKILVVTTTILLVLGLIAVYVFFNELIDVFIAVSVWYIYTEAFIFMTYTIYTTVKIQRQYEEKCRQNPQLCSD
jgi:hypothetical protein